MKVYLVWLMISVSSNGVVSYSPPMQSVQECQALRRHVSTNGTTDCVSVNIMTFGQQ